MNPVNYQNSDKTLQTITQPYTNSVEEKKPDSVLTEKMKNNFPFFGIGSMLYAAFYAFCLYQNASGITYPFFVAGTLFFFSFSMKKLGVPYKKGSVFYIISVVLLGISNCMTKSAQILYMNKCGIFLLSFILMLHTIYSDKEWNLPKYFIALFQTLVSCFSCLFRPFTDLTSYFNAQKQEKKQKNIVFLSIIIGIMITIPILFIMTALLANADIVFKKALDKVFSALNSDAVFRILLLMIIVFFCTYAVYAALCMKKVKEQVTDKKILDPVIAIVMTASLSAVYLVFSVIQILYLFIGKMKLPEGYTYSYYARQGFFQLLLVCILNLLLVLFCLHFFKENFALKVILTIISGCTYIMISSSALRMILYIHYYKLTFLRIFVLWSLAVISLLMAGVIIYIYRTKFPLFAYGLAVVTVLYLGLSFSHPDYFIAKYNLKYESGYCPDWVYSRGTYPDDAYGIVVDQYYLTTLSCDAAPVLLNPKENPYLTANSKLTPKDLLIRQPDYKNIYDEDTAEYYKHGYALRNFYDNTCDEAKKMHLRNFNFSTYAAMKYLYD